MLFKAKINSVAGNDVMTNKIESRFFKSLNKGDIIKSLGVNESVSLHIDEMLDDLCITYFDEIKEETDANISMLISVFEVLNIKVIPFSEALNNEGRVKEGIAILTSAVIDETKSPIHLVSNLYNNPIIGVFNSPPPVSHKASNQEKLDSIVSVLAQEFVHIALFVQGDQWTICTMNGAVIDFSFEKEAKEVVFFTLIPKLTAQVTPPQMLSTLVYKHNEFDPLAENYAPFTRDLASAANFLRENGMLMSHTSIDALCFKNKLQERLARKYLDNRTGMSYGFLVWQLPVSVKPAIFIESSESLFAEKNVINMKEHILVKLDDAAYAVEIPEVWVLSTRSGCDKTNLDLQKDIVRLGLVKGKIILETPVNYSPDLDCKPSYDTLTILAHALGNAIISSLLKTIKGDNPFSLALEINGASLFHWHGYTVPGQVLQGYYFHGYSNPSVSCSTPQSAIYTLYGKLEALKNNLEHDTAFLGDVHVEPHHGTNISSILSLTEVIRHVSNVYVPQ